MAGQSTWTDAEAFELANLDKYETFQNQRINVHFEYDVKHDMQYKARLVAGVHMTVDNGDAYSSVILLWSMNLALADGEANGEVPMVDDIGNACLEAFTTEKVSFVAGPGFGKREGHTLVIVKALYGLAQAEQDSMTVWQMQCLWKDRSWHTMIPISGPRLAATSNWTRMNVFLADHLRSAVLRWIRTTVQSLIRVRASCWMKAVSRSDNFDDDNPGPDGEDDDFQVAEDVGSRGRSC